MIASYVIIERLEYVYISIIHAVQPRVLNFFPCMQLLQSPHEQEGCTRHAISCISQLPGNAHTSKLCIPSLCHVCVLYAYMYMQLSNLKRSSLILVQIICINDYVDNSYDSKLKIDNRYIIVLCIQYTCTITFCSWIPRTAHN